MHSSRYMRSSCVPEPSHAAADILFTCLPRGPGPKFRTNARWTLEACARHMSRGRGGDRENRARASLGASFDVKFRVASASAIRQLISHTSPRPTRHGCSRSHVRRREHVRGSRRVARIVARRSSPRAAVAHDPWRAASAGRSPAKRGGRQPHSPTPRRRRLSPPRASPVDRNRAPLASRR